MNKTAYTDIVWLQTAFLGDLILTLAAMQVARNHFPHAKQHLITTRIGSKALAGQGWDSITVFEKRKGLSLSAMVEVKRSVLAKVTQRSSSVLLQPHRSMRSSLLAKYLGLRTITYDETTFSCGAFKRIPRVASFHEATRVALLLEPLGIARESLVGIRPRMQVPLGPRPEWLASLQALPRPRIAIAPGSVWGTKRWPLDYFTELTRKLLACGYSIVFTGSVDEALYAQPLMECFAGHSGVLNLIGKSNLEQLPWLYQELQLVVCNDSAPLHYASAFNIPTVAIFGATVPALGFGPLADEAAVCELRDLRCRPCSDHGPKVCPLGHFKCMKDLSSDKVFEAVTRILG